MAKKFETQMADLEKAIADLDSETDRAFERDQAEHADRVKERDSLQAMIDKLQQQAANSPNGLTDEQSDMIDAAMNRIGLINRKLTGLDATSPAVFPGTGTDTGTGTENTGTGTVSPGSTSTDGTATTPVTNPTPPETVPTGGPTDVAPGPVTDTDTGTTDVGVDVPAAEETPAPTTRPPA